MFSLLPSVLLRTIKLDEPSKSVSLKNLDTFSQSHKHLIVELSIGSLSPLRCAAKITFNDKDHGPLYYTSSISSDDQGVGQWCSAEKKDRAHIHGPDLGKVSGGYTSGYMIFPYCYQDDREKTTMGFFCHEGRSVTRITGQYHSQDPLETITISLPRGAFSAGSIIRLYGVDQVMQLEEVFLRARGTLVMKEFSEKSDSVILVGSVRSSSSGFDYARLHQGDRVYHTLNGDDNGIYCYQRLTSEGRKRKRTSDAKDVVGMKRGKRLRKLLSRFRILKIVVQKSKARIPGAGIQSLSIKNEGGEEKRVAWVPNSEAPEGLFGVHTIIYPNIAEERHVRSWLSFHGAYDGVWDPVANETGFWQSREGLMKIYLYPRGGLESKGRDAEAGSVVSLYGIDRSRVIYEVKEETSRIEIECPLGGHNLQVLINASSKKSGAQDVLQVRFNEDHDIENYECRAMMATNRSHVSMNWAGPGMAMLPAADADNGQSGIVIISILEYEAEDRRKQILCCYGGERVIGLCGAVWRRYDPIRRMELSLESGSLFTLGSKIEVWEN